METEGGAGSVICIGDKISFLVENSGYLAIPSAREPIPEKDDCVTHLRAIAFRKADKSDVDDVYPADYSVRLGSCYLFSL